jgi:hypothetical protein
MFVKGRLFVAAFVLCLAQPATGFAGDTPWAAIKQLFQKPVGALEQRFEPLQPSQETSSNSGTAVEALIPVPPPRPEIAIPFAAVPPLPAIQSTAAIPVLPPPSPAAGATCHAVLARLGVDAAALAPVNEGRCGIAKPVAIASLGGGVADLTAKAITECALAERLASWMNDTVQPQARAILGSKVTGLRVAASYHCRTRNGVAGAKLSEHGRGNAIDISAFKIDGRGWIEVGGAHRQAEARFLDTIRGAACGPFTTVLGPGADAHHSDHFHLDLAARNKGGKSRGLYCK